MEVDNQDHVPALSQPKQYRQTCLSQFFQYTYRPSKQPLLPPAPNIKAHQPTNSLPAERTQRVSHTRKETRKLLLKYNALPDTQTKLTNYTVPIRDKDLYGSWGHSLPAIDPS